MHEVLEGPHRLDLQVVEGAAGTREDREHLVLDRQRRVLALLQELDQPFAARQLLQGDPVEVGAELGERRERPVLRQVEAQGAGVLAHRVDLRVAADPADRDADVDRRAHAGEEEVALEEDLPVGDRDDVGRDVGRDVAGLGLDDRQRGERAAAVGPRQLRRPLQQPGVEVEDVAGVGLAARRTPQQQGDLAVGGGLLGQIVVDHQRVLAVVEEVLAHRAAGVGGDELERRRLGGRGGDDDRVLHRAVVLERLDDLGNSRALLADRDVDADHVAALLVDDRVDGDRRLADLPVADDQLALAAADRDHRVDRLDPGLHRLGHGLPFDDAGGDPLERVAVGGLDRPLAVDRIAERVDHAADHRRSDRDLHDPARAADLVALVDQPGLAHQHRADLVLFEVQRQPVDVVRKRQQLAGHRLLQPVDAGDAVTDAQDGADLGDVDLGLVTRQLALEDRCDLIGSYLHVLSTP